MTLLARIILGKDEIERRRIGMFQWDCDGASVMRLSGVNRFFGTFCRRVRSVPWSNNTGNTREIHYDGSEARIYHSFIIITSTFAFRTNLDCKYFVYCIVLNCIVSVIIHIEHHAARD